MHEGPAWASLPRKQIFSARFAHVRLRSGRVFGFRTPAKSRLPCSTRFIETPNDRRVRSTLDERRILVSLTRDGLHGLDKLVERFFRLGFRGLDHQRSRNDE